MALDNFDSVSVGLLVVSCGNNTWGGSIHIIGSSQLKVVEALVLAEEQGGQRRLDLSSQTMRRLRVCADYRHSLTLGNCFL